MPPPARKKIRERVREILEANPGASRTVVERRTRLIRALRARAVREAFEEEALNGPVRRGPLTFHRIEVVAEGEIAVWLGPHDGPPEYRLVNPPMNARDLVAGDIQLGDEPDRRFREDPLTAIAQGILRGRATVREGKDSPAR
jgi:hypothetical protein